MTDASAGGDLAGRVSAVRARIASACRAAGRTPDEVTLVAVAKTFDAAAVRQGLAAGLTDFGENRVQEAQAKIPQVGGGRWHMVGRVQRNKARAAAALFALIHSVDSERLARRLEQVRGGRACEALLQVNLIEAAAHGGVGAAELPALAASIDRETGLTLRGLMTIGPLGGSATDVRACYRRLRGLRDELRPRLPNQPLHELSMGMTDDFELAIAEGATIVRVGRAIFGERPSAARVNAA